MTKPYYDKALLVERGLRLKRLRALAGLTRDELAERAGVSRASMSYWENATYNGLSHKAAEKVIPVIQAEGIHCSVEWLLLGLGAVPYRLSEEKQIPYVGEGERASIQKEIALFSALNTEVVVMQILHNGMAPFFMRGDYIGGVLQPVMKMLEPNTHYIVRLNDTWQVRCVKYHPETELYDLSYIKAVEGSDDLFEMRGVRLEGIAKIIRVWRHTLSA